MRYMLMHKLDETRPEAFNPSPEFMARMEGFMEGGGAGRGAARRGGAV